MSTNKRIAPPKQAKRAALTFEQQSRLREVVIELDFTMFEQRLTIAEALAQVQRECRFVVSKRWFWQARVDYCEWYGKRRYIKPLDKTALDEGQWNKLQSTVRRLADQLRGRSIEQAVQIVGQECRTNAAMLRGLLSTDHVWRK
jgi:hypothetical protein